MSAPDYACHPDTAPAFMDSVIRFTLERGEDVYARRHDGVLMREGVGGLRPYGLYPTYIVGFSSPHRAGTIPWTPAPGPGLIGMSPVLEYPGREAEWPAIISIRVPRTVMTTCPVVPYAPAWSGEPDVPDVPPALCGALSTRLRERLQGTGAAFTEVDGGYVWACHLGWAWTPAATPSRLPLATCSRPAGHSGRHHAVARSRAVVAVWS